MTALERLVAEEFELLDKDIIHLNHAGVAPWPKRTAEAVKRFAEENATLGPFHYERWLAKEQQLRRQAQQLLGAPSPADIALVKNTSEGLSFVAYGLDWRPGDNVVISDAEFPSNRIVWESLQSRGVSVREAPLAAGETPEEALFARVDERTRLLSVSAVQYGNGLRMDLARIGAFCKAHDLLFCVDAIQALGALHCDVQAIQADFLAADGHKWLLAPEGLGIFYVAESVRDRLALTQYGWHMTEAPHDFDRRDWRPAASARRFECGSPNMLGIHALSASLSLLQECGIETIAEIVIGNSVYLIERLNDIPGIQVITPAQESRLSGIVSFSCENRESGAIVSYLREHGVICAERAGYVRFSPHFYVSRRQLDHALRLLEAALA